MTSRERPILFSGPMVRALLDGRKTQTRRAVKGLHFMPDAVKPNDGGGVRVFSRGREVQLQRVACPYGAIGDRLWVRETHAIYNAHGQHRSDGLRWGPWGHLPTRFSEDRTQIAYYRQGFDRCDPGKWRPSIHMPRWACRLELEITDVRAERLHEITEADAIAEGVDQYASSTKLRRDRPYDSSLNGIYREGFSELWEAINGAGSWEANPWVWAVSFEIVQAGEAA